MLARFTKQLSHIMAKYWKRFLTIFAIIIYCILMFGFTSFATKQFTMCALIGYVGLAIVVPIVNGFIKDLNVELTILMPLLILGVAGVIKSYGI